MPLRLDIGPSCNCGIGNSGRDAHKHAVGCSRWEYFAKSAPDTERPPASMSILQLPPWAESKAAELSTRLAAALGDDGGARRVIDHLVLTRGLLGAAAEVESIEKQARAMGWT